MEDRAIGGALMAARARLGWTRETLAHHSGVSWSAIAQIESGRRKDVRVSTLWALADALGVTVDYLVRRSGSPELASHRLLLFGSDEELLSCALPFLREGLERSEFVLVVTTPANRALLRDELGGEADAVVFAQRSDWYSSPQHALRAYRDLLEERCRPGAPWVRIMGERSWSDRPSEELAAWARYEAVINLTWTAMPATIICMYDTRSVPEFVLADACRTHPQFCSAGEVRPSPEYLDPEKVLLEAR
jgi:transcriptional regulator with XRE-family HTH domain